MPFGDERYAQLHGRDVVGPVEQALALLGHGGADDADEAVVGDVGERSGLDDELADALLALGDDAALMSNPSDVVVLRRELGDVVDVDRCGEEGAATTVTARMQCGDGEPWIPRQLIGGVDADHTAPGKPEVAVVQPRPGLRARDNPRPRGRRCRRR